jgi:GAF domain-containing protein
MINNLDEITNSAEGPSKEPFAWSESITDKGDQEQMLELDVDQETPQKPSFVKMLIAPLIYPNGSKSRTARLLNIILLFLIAATVLVYFTMVIVPNPMAIFVTASIMLLIEVTSFVLLRLGQVRSSSIMLSMGLWLILVFISMSTGGMSNIPYIALVLMVTVAVLLFGGVAGFIYAIFNFVIGFVLLIMGINGLSPNQSISFNLTSFWFSMNVIFLASAGLIFVANKGMEEAIKLARTNERAQAVISRELYTMRISLEQQVSRRTQELQNRTNYLQTSIEISQVLSSILDTDQLMQETVNLIQEKFDLYYVGLFILDTSGEWAILRSGTGMAGKAMLERNYRIGVGSGIIGWSIINAQPRVSLVVSEDDVHLATPELPDTASEAAFPLRSRGNVLGALSIQSEQPGTFNEMQLNTFQALADQLAIALDNANLLQESQKALAESQIAYGTVSRQAWDEYLRRGYELGYRYDQKAITQLQREPDGNGKWEKEIHQVKKSGQRLQVTVEDGSALFLPLLVRDQVIGVINLFKDGKGQNWTDDEIALLETITGQLGIALDGARMYLDTQRLAFREQLTGEITSRIRETLDVETVLRTAAQEIQKTLDLHEVVISLGTPEGISE